MLDGLFGSKFSNKCKHAIKYIRLRSDPIRKKKQAMLRHLRRDVAELLAQGHDLNAFGRIEALIIEINQASCYDMIEQFCGDILKQLQCMQKQREYPEEAKEAISTLIFAAARFPDLPELCDLRQVFTERFSSRMESFVSSEFVERIEKKSFSDDKKIQLMQNIAQEFSIGFDSKAFQRKLSGQPEPKFDQPKKASTINRPQNIDAPHERKLRPKPVITVQKYEIQEEPRDFPVIPTKPEKTEIPFDRKPKKINQWETKREECPEKNYRGPVRAPTLENKTEKSVVPPYTKSRSNGIEDYVEKLHENKVKTQLERQRDGSVKSSNNNNNKVINMNPPYTKPPKTRADKFVQEEKLDFNSPVQDTPGPINLVPPYVKNDERPRPVSVRKKYSESPVATDSKNEIDSKNGESVSRTPSNQTRRHKSRDYEEMNESEDNSIDYGNLLRRTPSSSSRRKHRVKNPSINNYELERDDEERMMDKLLMHYSKKGLARPPPPPPLATRSVDPVHRAPERAVSLPVTQEEEPVRPPARAVSMQPDLYSPNGGRVHPKLPDYDELAARISALRRA